MINRRDFLAAAAASSLTAGGLLSPAAKAEKQAPLPFETLSYPDPRFEIIDDKFACRLGNAGLERLATGFRWAEGPVYFPAQGAFYFSDVPNNVIWRLFEEGNVVLPYRRPSNFANGNSHDHLGRLLTCEHKTRQVTRTEHDGTISAIATHYKGARLNAPNDVISHPDGSVYFTDPGYGLEIQYEGAERNVKAELPNAVYCLKPGAKDLQVVTTKVRRPNGLAFSPDFKTLYVVDSATTDGGKARLYSVPVDSGKETAPTLVLELEHGMIDGFKIDTRGRFWCGLGWGGKEDNGVVCYSPDFRLLAKIHLPEPCGNLCFGGSNGNRLFMTASTSVYAIYLNDV